MRLPFRDLCFLALVELLGGFCILNCQINSSAVPERSRATIFDFRSPLTVMLFKHVLSRFSFIKTSVRTFSLSVPRRSKEFTDRHLQSLIDDHEFTSMSSALLHIRAAGHRVYVIQPSMKFKARGRQSTTAELQLAESVALVHTLHKWRVVGHGIYTLKSSGTQRYLYGKGNIEKITQEVRQCQATAVFVSIDRLSLAQIDGLTEKFRVPVYDRYSIVLQVDTSMSF